MSSPTDKQTKLYANLMNEVKVRIKAIELSVNGHLRLSTPFVREFCWLQLRMLCELISLSCLVAHGDIAFLQAHKMGRSYSADDIFQRMTKLREHFYPFPYKAERKVQPTGQIWHDAKSMPTPLSKDDFLKLYATTHKHLHRGSLKKLLSMADNHPLDRTIDAPEIIRWAQRIADLLSEHVIAINQNTIIICVLQANDQGRVQVAVAEAEGLPKPGNI